MKDFVYVISGEHGRQKIGCSDNPKQRLKELQTGSPYPLKLEFVGEAENRSGGQIEVEAHFMLHPHKSAGGDEWFTVPSDVAITAVMAAAHRLGYRLKPVDVNAVASPSASLSRNRPLWLILVMSPLYIWCFYRLWADMIPKVESGDISVLAGFIALAIVIGALTIVEWAVRKVGNAMIAAIDFKASPPVSR